MSAAPARRLLFLSFAFTLAVTSTAGAQAPAAAPPPPPPGWTGSIGGGLAITSGNSDTSTTNVGYDVLKDHGTNVIFKSAGLLPVPPTSLRGGRLFRHDSAGSCSRV